MQHLPACTPSMDSVFTPSCTLVLCWVIRKYQRSCRHKEGVHGDRGSESEDTRCCVGQPVFQWNAHHALFPFAMGKRHVAIFPLSTPAGLSWPSLGCALRSCRRRNQFSYCTISRCFSRCLLPSLSSFDSKLIYFRPPAVLLLFPGSTPAACTSGSTRATRTSAPSANRRGPNCNAAGPPRVV